MLVLKSRLIICTSRINYGAVDPRCVAYCYESTTPRIPFYINFFHMVIRFWHEADWFLADRRVFVFIGWLWCEVWILIVVLVIVSQTLSRTIAEVTLLPCTFYSVYFLSFFQVFIAFRKIILFMLVAYIICGMFNFCRHSLMLKFVQITCMASWSHRHGPSSIGALCWRESIWVISGFRSHLWLIDEENQKLLSGSFLAGQVINISVFHSWLTFYVLN